MKQLLFLLILFSTVTATAQVGNFSTIKVGTKLQLKTKAITDFTIDFNNSDSLSNAKVPTAKAVADFIRTRGGVGGGSMVYPGAGIPLSTGSSWGASITNNSANWNTAFGWGNHASAGYLTGNQTITVSATGGSAVTASGSGTTSIPVNIQLKSNVVQLNHLYQSTNAGNYFIGYSGSGTPTSAVEYGINGSEFSLTSELSLNQVPFSKLTGLPTTVAGYGISNALVKPASGGVVGYLPYFSGSQFTEVTAVKWDNVNLRLGINQSTPLYTLDIAGAIRVLGSGNAFKHGVTNSDFPTAYTGGAGASSVVAHTGSDFGHVIVRSTNDASSANSAFYRTRGGGIASVKGALVDGDRIGATTYMGVAADGTTVANGAATTVFAIPTNSGSAYGSGTPPTNTIATIYDIATTSLDGILYSRLRVRPDGSIIIAKFTGTPPINNGSALQIEGEGTFSGSGAFGTTSAPTASAVLDLVSTTKGFAPPRMNGTQMNAISSPVFGLVVANTDSLAWCYYDGTSWKKFGSATGGGGTMIYPGAGIPLSTGTGWGTSITDNSANWNTAYTNRITSLTNTGSSGAATLVSNVLNIPNYTLAGLGGQPALSGTGFVKISGTTISYDNSSYYLASNPNGYTNNTGTVTSVAMTVPTGLSISGSPITGSGTLGVTYTAGYAIPTTSKQTEWDSAYARSTRNSYLNNASGTGDSLVVAVNDSTAKVKRIEVVAGSNVTVTPTVTADKISYSVASTGGGGSYTGSKSVLLTSSDFTLVNDSTTLVQDRVYAYSSTDATRGWKKTNVTNFTSLANKDLMWYNSATQQWNNVVYDFQKLTEQGFTTDQPVRFDEGVTLTVPTTVVNPAASRIKLYDYKVGGRNMLSAVDNAGQVYVSQPMFAMKTIRKWLPAGNSTTIVSDGAPALTATGTATAANVATTNRHTIIPGLEYLVTTAATTAVAGFREPAAQKFMGNSADNGGFTFVCVFGPATGVSTTTNRLFVGMSSSTSAPTDVEPSSQTNSFGVGWDAADANIQFMTNDGTGTATKTSLGIAVPTADRTSVYRLEMHCDPNSTTLTYTFRDLAAGGSVVSGTVTTDLPAVNTLLAARGYMSVGGTSSVIGISLKSLYIESLY